MLELLMRRDMIGVMKKTVMFERGVLWGPPE